MKIMTKIYSSFFLIILSVFLSSCKKEEIQLESLGKIGGEFYFGERVPVWATTKAEKEDISYEWKATGGSFDGWRTQNLYENLWVAPAEVGEYTVTATAKKGNSTSSRSTIMKVTRYFFDEFESPNTFTQNGWAQSNTSQTIISDNDPNINRVELTALSTSAPNIRRTLNLADLKIPFSVRARLGWKTFFRANQPMTIRLFFRQPTANPSYPYMREIRFEIWPTRNPATADNYQLRYETFVPNQTTSSRFSANTNTTATLPLPLPLITPVMGRNANLAMANGAEKNISISIDANNVFHAYIDGTLWFTSNGFKQWYEYCKANYPGFEEPVAREFQVSFPQKANASETATTIFLNSVYINNDGEILK
jgi:hypothetical protein